MQQIELNQALLDAISHRDIGKMVAILEQGANPNAITKGWPYDDPRSIWQKLRERLRGINSYLYNFPTPPFQPALCLAIRMGPPENLKMAEILLDKGADTNMRNGAGATALIEATGDSDLAVVKMLLQRGADANISAYSGYSALRVAYNIQSAQAQKAFPDRQATEILKILKQAGAKK